MELPIHRPRRLAMLLNEMFLIPRRPPTIQNYVWASTSLPKLRPSSDKDFPAKFSPSYGRIRSTAGDYDKKLYV